MLQISSDVMGRIEDLRASWQVDKILTVEDFLPRPVATKVAEFLEHIPDKCWSVSVHPHHPSIYTFDKTPENRQIIEAAIKSATEENDQGRFAYFFRRHEPAANDEFDFQQFLTSRHCLDFFERVTGETLEASISVFCSCYHTGCFLSTHTDTGRGKIAFVYNATRDWDESDGGCFELLSRDRSRVERTVPPTYNSLTFFHVEGDGVPHRVTRVSAATLNRRLAISGWLV